MIAEIQQQSATLAALCRQYRVRRLRLFGSAYADRYLDFAEALERLFNRHVDVLTERAIRNPYFRAEVERATQVVYEDGIAKTPA